MKIEIYLTARDGSYDAHAIYEDGLITIKKGSKIRLSFAQHVRGGKIAKRFLDDRDVVNLDGITQKECSFNSPSTAAQFVMGSSVNGWTAWHVDRKRNLKQYVDAAKENT